MTPSHTDRKRNVCSLVFKRARFTKRELKEEASRSLAGASDDEVEEACYCLDALVNKLVADGLLEKIEKPRENVYSFPTMRR